MKDVFYCILAGGRGERLMPLTNDRPKPLVRFGPSGRIIDFSLYNCLASGGGDCIVLTQYYWEMIDEFLDKNWKRAFAGQGRKLSSMPAARSVRGRYLGTADAVYQALILRKKLPDHVVVLAGDHVYKMAYNDMISFHMSHGGAATVGAVNCDRREVHRFGIIEAGKDGRIRNFHEKPASLDGIVDGNAQPLSSMGIYVFTTRKIIRVLEKMLNQGRCDFGKDIMPELARKGQAWTYVYSDLGGNRAYWRDIGEMDAYLNASMEVINGYGKDLNFKSLPGLDRIPFSNNKVTMENKGHGGRIINSLIAPTARIEGATIKNSIVGPDVKIESGAVVRDSVLMDGAFIGKRVWLNKAVVEPHAGVGAGWISTPEFIEDLNRNRVIKGLHFPYYKAACQVGAM